MVALLVLPFSVSRHVRCDRDRDAGMSFAVLVAIFVLRWCSQAPRPNVLNIAQQ